VSPSPATLKELHEAESANKKKKTGQETDHEEEQEDEDEKDEDKVTVLSLSDTFETLSISLNPPPQHQVQQSFLTPPWGSSSLCTTPQFSPHPSYYSSPMDNPRTHLPPGSVVAGQSCASSTFSSGELSLELTSPVDGTPNSPFKFLVNRQYPEKNPVRMKFTRVMKYEYQGFERTVWEVAITVPHPNFSKWEAYFVKPNKILFKGPSRGYWESQFPNDPIMKKAHKAAELAIKKNPLHEENWWQVEIPKEKDEDMDVVLDNIILSRHSNMIKREVQKLMSVEYGELKGCVLVWKIAEVGGIQMEKQEESLLNLQSFLMNM
jgi:hypothetical protein